ncbi:MAG: hypothetical protein B6244_05285 [Candidatus Cloacimonetes bacterium 4572_55]|nr:MAG: hypothetical protein B6244_05285 [Candidatus Cloacimonetes bacterium 4572_55]
MFRYKISIYFGLILIAVMSGSALCQRLSKYDVPMYKDLSVYGYENPINKPQQIARRLISGGHPDSGLLNTAQRVGKNLMQINLDGSHSSGKMVVVQTTGAMFELLKDQIFVYQRLARETKDPKLLFIMELPDGFCSRFFDYVETDGCVQFTSGNKKLKFKITGDSILMIENQGRKSISIDYRLRFYPGYTGRHGDVNDSGHSTLFLDNYGGFGVYLTESQPVQKRTKENYPLYRYHISGKRVFWTSVCPPKEFDWELAQKVVMLKWGGADIADKNRLCSGSIADPVQNFFYHPYVTQGDVNYWINKETPSSSPFEIDYIGLVSEINLWQNWHFGYVPRDVDIHGWQSFDNSVNWAHKGGKKILFYISPSQFYGNSSYIKRYGECLSNNYCQKYCPITKGGWAPGNPEGENLSDLLQEANKMINHRTYVSKQKSDGIYIDGMYSLNIPQSYLLLRNLRSLIGPKRKIILHSAPLPGGDAYLPQIDAYADFTFRGEGGHGHYKDEKYIRYFVGTYNISNSVGLFLWDQRTPYSYDKTLLNDLLTKYNLRLPIRSLVEDLVWSDKRKIKMKETLLSSHFFEKVPKSSSEFQKKDWKKKQISYRSFWKTGSLNEYE